MAEHEHVRVAVIGSGFGGLGAAVRLRREGITDFVVLERAGGVGGTWRDNSYPGCACDVPSHLYSFSFAPNPDWPRSFSGQEHIRAYLERVTDTFGLRPHLRFNAEVKRMTWDAERLRWDIETTAGNWSADVVVSATGPLSEPKLPDLPGLDGFPGKVFHSARWDHDYDLRGKRVAVIGTGASAIQIVPSIQPQVEKLTLFQRTPAWVLPRMDRPIGAAERAVHRALPFTTKLRRGVLWGLRELQVQAFTKHPGELGFVEQLAKRNMARAVKDPALRAKLTPDYRIGCKRILLSSTYYPALAQPNVDVVASGLSEVRGSTLVAADGTELARGHSREGGDPVVHAEEAALAKADPTDPRLAGATVYSSLEPCARRASRPAPCARLILDAGVRRVVTAWREPDTFVTDADGSAVLADGGATVLVLPEYEQRAKAPNAHLLGG
ncbi:NAD(P)-binding domain-containing protein [Streptomyces pseudogriseolus]|uniref:NAD(P)-binding domain-containing protein n=1 Tax=Streptomyces pseudogriseolus TaxID=36817 RepID=UPI000A3BDD3A